METVRNIKTGRETRRPEWVGDTKAPDYGAADDVNVGSMLPPRLGYDGAHFQAAIILRGDEDIIYQFSEVKHSDFRTLLAEVIESHFGDTDNFKFDSIPEIPNAFGLLAKGVRGKPFFNAAHYTSGFLDLLDGVLSETQG